jgi:signal transduction histidine kinase
MLGLTAAVGFLYFLAAHFSLALLVEPDGVAAFWPAAGISSGILIALGPDRKWPVAAGVVAATLAANLTGDRNVLASVVFAAANAAEAIITAGLVHDYFREGFNLDRIRQVLGLLAAAIVGTVVSGVIGAVGYKLFHSPAVPMLITWWHWFASDAVGIIVVAPLVIKIGAIVRDPPRPGGVIEGLAALAVLAAITGAVVLSLPSEPWKTTLPAALLFPTLLWLAARCRPVFSAAGAFIVSFTIVLATIFGVGHFGDPRLLISDRVLQAQAIILVVTIGTYILSALFAERRASAARLADANVLLERERDSKLLNVEAAMAWVAHELSQPLTGILANCSAALRFLESASPDQQKAKASLSRIEDQAARLHEIFDGIRTFFRSGNPATKPVNANEVIRRAVEPFRGDFSRHRIVVHLKLTPSLPPVDGNEAQLQQVISNLVRNALEAMQTTTARPRLLRLRTELRGREAVGIAVEDSGPGMDPTQLDNAFGAFFTTKHDGMGLGLAICRLIVERHGGEITVSSDGSSGTQFNLILPVSPTASNDAPGSSAR